MTNKEPKVGKVYYRFNKKTKEIENLTIVDIQYVFDRKIGSRANFTKHEIEELISNETITDNSDVLKRAAIEKIEKQFGIKLKEV